MKESIENVVDKVVIPYKGGSIEVWSTNKPSFESARDLMKEKLRSRTGR